jgi:2-polyprenyl-3-methyl-5-hydroxy-6-metoxy-1,4-benzoquinol methylase
MEKNYASKYHELEENHWWFLGRRDILYRLVKSCRRDAQILEVGCSGGPLIRLLKAHGFKKIRGIDIDEEAIKVCKQRGIDEARVADAENTGFQDQQFDLIIASDILEHIENEEKALSEWNRILKSGGKLIIFVPAFNFLWSGHDERNIHYRRYSKSKLLKVVEREGFTVQRISFWNFSLFLPVCLRRLAYKVVTGAVPGDNLYQANAFVGKILATILRIENILLSKLNFPFGISIFAIARKI